MKWLPAFLGLVGVASGCSVPSFGYQSLPEQTLNACRDHELSPGEADVDCGRVCNLPCAADSSCTDDVDCASGFCFAGICEDQTCSDTLKNQDESDVDCGGLTGCPACASGKACLSDSDCASAMCASNVCRAPQTCSDTLKDQDESDVDCGGTTGCAPCAPGKVCTSISDCDGGACRTGVCHTPSCSDGVKNQTESDVDCGGTCDPCASGNSCRSVSDCDRALCTGGKCRSQSCSDGLLNQDESDIDCGGTSGCARCAANQQCVSNADCEHASCSKGTCQQPASCSDGALNGSETDVDCGGGCQGCASLAACLVAKDCASLVCTAATHQCAAPTCSDGMLNGTEPTVDCGAGCSNKCKIADVCAVPADCASKTCTNQRCAAGGPTVELARGKATSASSVENGNPSSSANDGVSTTRWAAAAGSLPQWWRVDLGSLRTLQRYTLTFQWPDRQYSYTIETSTDGSTFANPQAKIGTGPQTGTFPTTQARYVRVTVTASKPASYASLSEVSIQGY
jgi:hypothetical protein